MQKLSSIGNSDIGSVSQPSERNAILDSAVVSWDKVWHLLKVVFRPCFSLDRDPNPSVCPAEALQCRRPKHQKLWKILLPSVHFCCICVYLRLCQVGLSMQWPKSFSRVLNATFRELDESVIIFTLEAKMKQFFGKNLILFLIQVYSSLMDLLKSCLWPLSIPILKCLPIKYLRSVKSMKMMVYSW